MKELPRVLTIILILLFSWVMYEIFTTPTVWCSKLEYWREVYSICD